MKKAAPKREKGKGAVYRCCGSILVQYMGKTVTIVDGMIKFVNPLPY